MLPNFDEKWGISIRGPPNLIESGGIMKNKF